jgi:cytochrome c-type biogenesis protein
MIPGLFAAFAAGLLSFLSPCVLPLIPVYISFISGESAADLRSGNVRRFPILLRSLFFVSGFTVVFVLLAVIFGGGMRFIGSSASLVISRIAGVLVIILGVNILFDFLPFLRRDSRAQAASSKGLPGAGKSMLLGMAFAAGWSPCIGPILSSILLYAGRGGNVPYAAILLALYSVGLGLPFVLAGIFFDRMIPVLGWFKRHMTAVKIISGLLLIAFGVSMLTGSLSGITIFFLKAGSALEEFSQTGPLWLRPAAAFIARWLSFQGL